MVRYTSFLHALKTFDRAKLDQPHSILSARLDGLSFHLTSPPPPTRLVLFQASAPSPVDSSWANLEDHSLLKRSRKRAKLLTHLRPRRVKKPKVSLASRGEGVGIHKGTSDSATCNATERGAIFSYRTSVSFDLGIIVIDSLPLAAGSDRFGHFTDDIRKERGV